MGNESDATLHLDPMDLDEIPSVEKKVTAPPPVPPSVPSPGGAENDVGAVDQEALDDTRLVQWLEGELAREGDPLRAARLHFELGLLYERASQPERACEQFEKAHSRSPAHVASIRAARRLSCSLGRFEQALPLFEAELPHAGTPEQRARLMYARGRLLEAQLERVDDALASYRQGLELAPRDLALLRATARIERAQRRWAELDGTLEVLASVVEAEPAYRAQLLAERARIADLHAGEPERALQLYLAAREVDPEVLGAGEALQRLGQTQGQWRRTLDALQLEAAHSEDAEVRAAAQSRVAELYLEPLGDLERAAAALEAAVAELPADAERLWQLAEVYERAERPGDYARVLDRLRSFARSSSERADLAHRVGFVCETRLQDGSLAEKFYREALEACPEHGPALGALAHLYESTGDHIALLALVRARAEAARDTAERAALHLRAGELVEKVGGEIEQAVHHYRLALSLDPTQLTALGALDRTLPQLGRFAELAQVYEEMVDHAEDDAQALNYLFRIGALQEDRLGDLAAARHAYERVLRRVPDHTGALHALQRVALAEGNHALLVQYLEQELQLREPSVRWARLGYRVAELCVTELGDPERALIRLRAILEHDPEHAQARQLLARVYRSEKRWEELVCMRRDDLERMPDGDARTALAYELGLLCETELGQVEQAAEYYGVALGAEPLHRPAFDALTKLLERGQMWQRLVKVLEARGEAAEDARERAHLAVRCGKLWEGPLGDPDRAQQAYGEALQDVPELAEALDARTRLLAQQGRHLQLADALEQQAEVSRDRRRWLETQLRLASLKADLLDDGRGAEEALLRVLEQQPGLLPALRDLEGLYARDADRASLGRVYADEAKAVGDETLRAAALRDLAHAHWGQPEVGPEAEQAFEQLLVLRPADPEALEVLVVAARLREDAPRLQQALSALTSLEQDRATAAAHRLALARLLETRVPREALEVYRGALSLQPDSLLAVRGLSRTAVTLKDPDALTEAAAGEARLTGDETLAVQLLIAAAGLRRRKGDLEGAARDAAAALERAPDDPRAVDALAAALEPRGERTRLADLLARAADRATRSERSAELHLRAAVLRAPVDLNAAIAACERALLAQPDHERALTELADYLQRAGEWARAADTLARLAEVSSDRERRCDAQLSLAEIAMERLHDRERAEPSLAKVLAERPDDRRALGLQGQLYAHTGQLERACEIAERLVEACSEPGERAAALLHASKVMEKCDKHEDAERALLDALSIQGHEGEAARLYRAGLRAGRGSWDAYVQALVRYLKDATARDENASGTVRVIAEVQLREQGSHERALKSLMAGIGRWPTEPGLHLDYAKVLEAMGEHDQALRVYRDQLALHPASPALWRGLSAAHRACGRQEEALSTALPLLLFEGAAGDELLDLKVRQPCPAGVRPGTLNDAMLRAIDRERVLASPCVDLVRELTGTLAKAQPADLGRFGLSRRDRIERGAETVLWEVVDGVASLLGLTPDAFDLYVHDQPDSHVSLALTEPASLLVPRAVAAQPPSTLVFALGAPMFLLSQGLAPVAASEPDTLLSLLAGGVRRQRPAFGSGTCDEEVLEEAEKTMAKAVPWLSRKKVDEAVARFGETSPNELQEWLGAAPRCAARVALLLSDDPVGSLQARALATGCGLFDDPLSRELLNFWASEAACLYRSRRAG